MTLQNDFPALKSSIYLNTAYVGLMSKPLYDFRTTSEKKYLFSGDRYKIEAYEQLHQTHDAIANFIGANAEQTFFVSNFSTGIRYVLDLLQKGSKVMCFEDDYTSLVAAVVERDFDLYTFSIDEFLEEKIEKALLENKVDALVLSLVQYASGLKIDFEFLHQIKEKYPKLLLIGDATQHIGSDHFDFASSPFDAVICSGYKWLLAGFGNGFVALSDRFLEVSQQSKEKIFDKIYAGHFNILGAASLVFAIDYLIKNDFDQLVKRNKTLSNFLREKLQQMGWVPVFEQRVPKSQITSYIYPEGVVKNLEAKNISLAHRRNYLRFSPHFYNTEAEIEELVEIVKKLNIS